MDLSRLKVLRELSRCGTMAAAAQALYLSPSAVSQQVAQLEIEAGVSLTERRGRGVVLAPAGQALVGYAERILVVLDEAKSEMAQLRKEIAGELRVAAFPSIACVVLPQTMKALVQLFPRLHVVLEEMEPSDGLAALRSWRVDVAIVDDLSTVLEGRPEGLDRVALTEDVLYALLPAGHPLAAKHSVSITDLRNASWALDATSSAYGDFIVNLCRRTGFEPRLNAACSGFQMVSAMVAAGCSVSVAPGLLLHKKIPGIKAVKLRPEVRRSISVAYRSGERNHPSVKLFTEELLRRGAALRQASPGKTAA
ncbi:LysR family transcriptional regulator [Bordetella genomosp. 10]|uniref:LysR family transcriptional regulator n=1 Tax=Bordetella genomosp. 10 TaxID=1416804 RepID=A0A261SB65_9BORD|nr:LysR family transcriptional regulator [Bordetella genomosp. 10]OZI34202.1 LysR family transcriptional regulator [Bordetella genomosp. 10]